MEVSPKTFREVEFREKMRGYHPEDVDQFLEQMAAGVEVLQDRLRQALERVQRAEQAAAEAGSSDETLRRTLVLAQRTADMAVQEAREQAARIVSSAEQQAHGIVAEAEERARQLHEEATADAHEQLAALESSRAQAQEEVEALNRWADEHRAHLAATLQEALATLDRAGLLSPPPASSPVDLPARSAPEPVASPAAPPAPAPERIPSHVVVDDGPPPLTAPPPAEDDATEAFRPPSLAGGDDDPTRFDPDFDEDEAMESFFDDAGLGDDRRFGGRLRRRR